MPNFFKSFFSGKSEDPENEKQKTAKKNFDSNTMDCALNVWADRIMP